MKSWKAHSVVKEILEGDGYKGYVEIYNSLSKEDQKEALIEAGSKKSS